MSKSEDIKIKGIIQKIARVNGKPGSLMTVEIPVSVSGDIALGETFITLSPVQPSMFPKKGGVMIKGSAKKGKDVDAEEDEDDEDAE